MDSQFLQTMQVGVGRRNKFCENIISVPLPMCVLKSYMALHFKIFNEMTLIHYLVTRASLY
ncbi:hypothetical protein FYM47_00090 [Staphylococcus aureus]|nr:hypothetical protein FYM49_09915 [Staphylococcus aureus]TYO34818.1 hypothetical protein FYM47_00090 [Staphylococcus aureus]TYO40782.1 hypothetical protein FYM32_04820 [Staphylococcus aureus]